MRCCSALPAALGVSDARASTVALRDNRVEHNGRFGIDVFTRGSVVVTGNRVLHNGGIPLAVHGRDALGDALLTANVLGARRRRGAAGRGAPARFAFATTSCSATATPGLLLRASPDAAAGEQPGVCERRPGDRRRCRRLAADDRHAGDEQHHLRQWQLGHRGRQRHGCVDRHDDPQQHPAAERSRRGHRHAPGRCRASWSSSTSTPTGTATSVSPAPTDLTVDPQFVEPAGIDGVLGNDKFADDDFRVQPTSAAIDAGSAPAVELGISGLGGGGT